MSSIKQFFKVFSNFHMSWQDSFWQFEGIMCFEVSFGKVIFLGIFLLISYSVLTVFFNIMRTSCLFWFLPPSLMLNNPIDIKLSTYQKRYCGLWVLLSCFWYVLVLTAHWPENTHHKPKKKKNHFSFPQTVLSACCKNQMK